MKKGFRKITLSVLIFVSILVMVALFACVSTAPKGVKIDPKTKEVVLDYDPNRFIFLLIGQSNMEGVPRPEPQDLEENSRIYVLAYQNSPRQKREYNKWYIASPPLHSSSLGVGVGDYFAKTLIQELPEEYSIGLVPCAIAGVDIDFFRKNIISSRRKEFRIPPDNSWDGAYDWVLERALLAQEIGTIAGIIFHQGESDTGQNIWITKVNEMVTDLRNDLEIDDLPILVGELLYSGACAIHNRVIKRIPENVADAYVISAEGLNGVDRYHFDLEGQREFGKRYAKVMLDILDLN